MENNELKNVFDDEDDNDDDDIFVFDNGGWIWDDVENRLAFKVFTDDDKIHSRRQRMPSWIVKFNDEDNVLEQLYFTKKFQRKITNGEPDVVILQDVKDVVLFTAPISLLNKDVINILHTQTYDRFVRALIVYTQYFLLVSKTLKLRIQEGRFKIRLPISDFVEKQWEDNLSDMRVIVAKEYFNFLHENFNKNHETESHLMEMILRLTVQIVWISLDRTNLNIIDIEINRLIRSEAFNISFHLSKDLWAKSLTEHEKLTLYGKSFETKLAKNVYKMKYIPKNLYKTVSPLTSAILSFKNDYKIFGIYHNGFKESETRMVFLEDNFCAPEEEFTKLKINIGILGQKRNLYDAMLCPIIDPKTGKHKKMNESAKASAPKKMTDLLSNLYELLELPKTNETSSINFELPQKYQQRVVNESQKQKWLKRIK